MTYFGVPRGLPSVKLLPMTTKEAQRRYVERFKALVAGAGLAR